TGSEMILWGGTSGITNLSSGGRYNPITDSWTATSSTNGPSGRHNHTAVWTDREMIVWSGANNAGTLNTGGRYNPDTDGWTGTTTTRAPAGREGHAAVWTGNEMIVWGGVGTSNNYFDTGGRYCATAPHSITLSGLKDKKSGINTVRLTWSGAT